MAPDESKAQFFRANVGVVIADSRGRVLLFERRDVPGAWQFPQGGIAPDEEPLDAAWRETREETGIEPARLELLAECEDWLTYELPPAYRSAKTGRGQTQRWFLFRLLGDRDIVDLPPDGEFRDGDWTTLEDAHARAVPFRRGVYRRLVDEFAPRLAARSGA